MVGELCLGGSPRRSCPALALRWPCAGPMRMRPTRGDVCSIVHPSPPVPLLPIGRAVYCVLCTPAASSQHEKGTKLCTSRERDSLNYVRQGSRQCESPSPKFHASAPSNGSGSMLRAAGKSRKFDLICSFRLTMKVGLVGLARDARGWMM